MRKRSEKPRKNIDIDQLEEFAAGAKGGGVNVKTGTGKKKKKKKELDRFHMAIDPNIKEAIQAIAWYDRISQREVVEKAIQKMFPIESEKVKTALKEYNKYNS